MAQDKPFVVKHSFFFMSILSILFLAMAGVLETNAKIKEFQEGNGIVAFLIWFSMYIAAIFFLYTAELREFFKSDKVVMNCLKAFASLKFTVFMLGVSLWLVFVGTLAQEEFGIWEVVNNYFRCFFTQVKISHMIPGDVALATHKIHYYFPGGYVIGGSFLVNLLTAHTLKFKFSASLKEKVIGGIIVIIGLAFTYWAIADGMSKEDIPSAYVDSYKRVLYRLLVGLGASGVLLIGCWVLFKKRAGIVILHFGIVLLLFSELITGFFQVEGNMRIEEGKTSSYIDVARKFELTVSSSLSTEISEDSISISDEMLKKAGVWQKFEKLPFQFKVKRWYKNSTLPQRAAPTKEHRGLGAKYDIQLVKAVPGIQSDQVNTPAFEIEFKDKEEKPLGTYIFSLLMYDKDSTYNQQITVGDKTLNLMFRNKREYLYSKGSTQPVQIKLIDFRHDSYLGTNVPKNYSSLVQLSDPAQEIDRKVLISMNNPLRYTGRTFYQSSFAPDESGTVLQVVRNPGWMIPYLCCVIVGMGLLFQFILTLIKFTNRKMKS